MSYIHKHNIIHIYIYIFKLLFQNYWVPYSECLPASYFYANCKFWSISIFSVFILPSESQHSGLSNGASVLILILHFDAQNWGAPYPPIIVGAPNFYNLFSIIDLS